MIDFRLIFLACIIYNDVEATQNIDKGQQYLFQTVGSQSKRYKHLKIQRSLPITQVEVRHRRKDQYSNAKNID
jgi:hypothetical protein